jgi:hypothetical protein
MKQAVLPLQAIFLAAAMKAAGLNPTAELADSNSADVGSNVIRISIDPNLNSRS